MRRGRRVGLVLFLLSGCAAVAWAQGTSAATPEAFAPAGVRAGGAVVVLDETTFRVEGDGGRLLRRRRARVLGPGGREHGRLAVFYDSFRRIRKLEGRLLGPDGAEVRRLGRDDVADLPASDGISLYDDNRVRVAELYHDAYPYTVEWTWEVEVRTLLAWSAWRPQLGGDPVLAARLTVDVPAGSSLRWRSQHLSAEPEVEEDGSRTVYRWATSLPALAEEPFGPAGYDQAPAIHFAPEAFEVEGYRGSLASWEAFGRWYRDLSVGRDQLPEAAKAEVAALVAGVEGPRERARVLYRYLQERTRYVSISLGLGGWQPFDAAYVHERRYGDCKALTNYLRALLHEAGIESFPALIGAGRPDPDPAFPRNAFNHVVLFVPMEDGEPVWLEATSSHAPFGQLGPGTEGRHALVVTPSGGQLVRTPERLPAQNRQVRTAEVVLLAGGTAEAEVTTRRTGYGLAALRARLAPGGGDERHGWLRERIGLPGLSLHGADFAGLEAADTLLTVAARFRAERYATATGRRLLFNPNLMERTGTVPPPVEGRTQPVEAFAYAFLEVDTVRYALPAGYAVEVGLEPVVVEAAFGRYEAAAVEAGGALVYARRLEVWQPRLAPEAYDAFRAFMTDVARADARQVVLVRDR